MRMTLLTALLTVAYNGISYAAQYKSGSRMWVHGNDTLGGFATCSAVASSGEVTNGTELNLGSTVTLFGAISEAVNVDVENEMVNGDPRFARCKIRVGGYTVLSTRNLCHRRINLSSWRTLGKKSVVFWVGGHRVSFYGNVSVGLSGEFSHGIFPFLFRRKGEFFAGILSSNGVRVTSQGHVKAVAGTPGASLKVESTLNPLDLRLVPYLVAEPKSVSGNRGHIRGSVWFQKREARGKIQVSASTCSTRIVRTLMDWSVAPAEGSVLWTW